jgi:hypothetical protein
MKVNKSTIANLQSTLQNSSITYNSETEQWQVEESIILDANGETFNYTKIGNGIFTYKDSMNNAFFVRLTYNATIKPYFELKTGWLENNNPAKPKYEPSLPQNTTSKDSFTRTNTVAKIFKNEIIPYFKNQKLSNELAIKPLSQSRYQFSIRLVRKYTPTNLEIIEDANQIRIVKC